MSMKEDEAVALINKESRTRLQRIQVSKINLYKRLLLPFFFLNPRRMISKATNLAVYGDFHPSLLTLIIFHFVEFTTLVYCISRQG